MDFEERLNRESVLGALSGHVQDEPRSWTVMPLTPGAGNPTSLGAYRIRGADADWSAVVKHLADGKPDIDSSRVEHWNYWLREPEFLRSQLFGLLPHDVRVPELYALQSQPDGTALLWSEDLGESVGAWNLPATCDVAQLMARVSAALSADEELLTVPWLSHDTARQWLGYQDLVSGLTDRALAADIDPVLHGQLSDARPILDDLGTIVDRMDRLPQVFCHMDVNHGNLVLSPLAVGVLDWQMCGVAALGSDAYNLASTAVDRGYSTDGARTAQTVVAAYADACDHAYSRRDIERGFYAHGLLTLAVFRAYMIDHAVDAAPDADAYLTAHAGELVTGMLQVFLDGYRASYSTP